MMKKNDFTAKMCKFAARTELLAKKKSPEILLAAGIAGFVGTVVLACKATLRADEVLDYHEDKMADIQKAKEIADKDPEGELEYDETMYHQDIAVQCLKTAGKMAKLYAPSIALGGLSLACILTSRNIMQKRYLGVVAAYNGVKTVLTEYRKRVRDELGVDKDKHFRYGTEISTEVITETDENGKKVKKKVKTENTDTLMIPDDDTSRWFDSRNKNWDQNPSFSLMWLRGRQNFLNDTLHTRGHVFLNEVYEALGFEHTPQGAVLGWVEGMGDDCIDFGLYDPHNEDTRRFINGAENIILLTFNHDGVIWDKI